MQNEVSKWRENSFSGMNEQTYQSTRKYTKSCSWDSEADRQKNVVC